MHLIDNRYEVRDAQEFAGRSPTRAWSSRRIGAVGGSYGGGMSMALAALRNRTMMPDKAGPVEEPGRQADGDRRRRAAVALDRPRLLADAQRQHARLRRRRALQRAPDRGREAVLVRGLYGPGWRTEQLRAAGTDPSADLTGWSTRLNVGEPYGSTRSSILDEITPHHSSYYIDHSSRRRRC